MRACVLAGPLLVGIVLAGQVNADEVVDSEEIIRRLTPATGPSAPRTRGLVKVEQAEAQAPIATPPSVNLHVEFAIGSSDLTTQAIRQLDQLAAALASPALAGSSFEVAGHADARGDARDNLELSQRRAEAVRTYLQRQHGVSAGRLRTIGWGEEKLLLPDRPYDARNRRVEVTNLGTSR